MAMALHLSTADVIHYVDVYFNGDIKTELKIQHFTVTSADTIAWFNGLL